MVMPSRSSSSGTQSIRRELQRRRSKPLAPKSSAANKSSLPLPSRGVLAARAGSHALVHRARRIRRRPPPPQSPHQPPPSPTLRRAPHPLSSLPSTLPPRSTPSSVGRPCRASPGAAAARLSPGTEVGVRTRTTKLKTGKVLVLWLRAMVVSPPTQQGCEVVYDGNWPPGDPYGTVRVPRRHVRMIKPSLSSPTTPPTSLLPSCAPSSSSASDTTPAAARKKEMRPKPRPTTAGKSLRLVRSLWPEFERQARAAVPGY